MIARKPHIACALLCGCCDNPTLWRYTSGGIFDWQQDFSKGGEYTAFGVQPHQGGYLTTGGASWFGGFAYDMGVWKFTSTGGIDTTFATSGEILFDAGDAEGLGLVVDQNDRIVVVGHIDIASNWNSTKTQFCSSTRFTP